MFSFVPPVGRLPLLFRGMQPAHVSPACLISLFDHCRLSPHFPPSRRCRQFTRYRMYLTRVPYDPTLYTTCTLLPIFQRLLVISCILLLGLSPLGYFPTCCLPSPLLSLQLQRESNSRSVFTGAPAVIPGAGVIRLSFH